MYIIYSSILFLGFRQKHCWVCFGTEDDEFEAGRDWVSPCKCRGSTRWVIFILYFCYLF